MNKNKWFTLMQKHISYFITLLEFYRFNSSSGFPHRSEVATLEKEHPSMFSENTDIIRIVNRFYTQYFFPICKLHDYGWKLFERKYKFFVNFFGTILIGYWASFPSEVVIGALFCFYFLFQGFALKKGLK